MYRTVPTCLFVPPPQPEGDTCDKASLDGKGGLRPWSSCVHHRRCNSRRMGLAPVPGPRPGSAVGGSILPEQPRRGRSRHRGHPGHHRQPHWTVVVFTQVSPQPRTRLHAVHRVRNIFNRPYLIYYYRTSGLRIAIIGQNSSIHPVKLSATRIPCLTRISRGKQ